MIFGLICRLNVRPTVVSPALDLTHVRGRVFHRVRTLSTVLLVVVIVFVVRQWGDFSDLFHHYVHYVRTASAGRSGPDNAQEQTTQ